MTNTRRLFLTLSFLTGIVCLQFLLRFSMEHFPQLQAQTDIIQSQGIDPAALFYTESKLALNAEKTVRQQISH